MTVVIVGGSVGGATTALALARAGVASVVLERRSEALDKVCGEGLQPAGRALLSGLLPELDELGAPFEGLRFHLGGGRTLAWSFPDALHGVGVERLALDRAMRAALAREDRIDWRPGVALRSLERTADGWRLETTEGGLEAAQVVAADGVASSLRGASGRARGRPRGRHGLRLRFADVRRPAHEVAVHFGTGVEAYVTPLGGGRTSVALLGDGERLAAARRGAWPALLSELGLDPGGTLQGEPALWLHRGARTRRVAADGLFFVGDAALVLDPISGAGMTLAVVGGERCARALARIAGGAAPGAEERAYTRDLHAATRPFERLTAFLLLVARSPLVRRGAGRVLAAAPSWIERLARPTLGVRERSV